MNVKQKAIIAISELMQTAESLELQQTRLEELLTATKSRIESIRATIAEIAETEVRK